MGGVGDRPVYLRIWDGEPLPDISGYAPFRAVLILEAGYSAEWQNQVSDWLVTSGCLYMMAWGHDCSCWDDSVDWAMQAMWPDEAPDEAFVMTTWHEEETLESVFWFSRFCAHDPYDLIEHSLIVHVGKTGREADFLALYAQAETLADREEDRSTE